jgi:hypothetical protein
VPEYPADINVENDSIRGLDVPCRSLG